MYSQAEATPPIIDGATYVGSVAVRPSPGRGRGLFTTKPVKAGELLLCEKAFAYSYASKETPASRCNTGILVNMNTDRVIMGGQETLLGRIVQKLYHNPETAAQFRVLHHGDYQPVTPLEVDGIPIVDRLVVTALIKCRLMLTGTSFLVERVVSLNSFGAPWSTLDQFRDGVETYTHSTCGSKQFSWLSFSLYK